MPASDAVRCSTPSPTPPLGPVTGVDDLLQAAGRGHGGAPFRVAGEGAVTGQLSQRLEDSTTRSGRAGDPGDAFGHVVLGDPDPVDDLDGNRAAFGRPALLVGRATAALRAPDRGATTTLLGHRRLAAWAPADGSLSGHAQGYDFRTDGTPGAPSARGVSFLLLMCELQFEQYVLVQARSWRIACLMRLDTRMSTLWSGRPRRALRGHTVPVAMTAGPSQRSSTAAGNGDRRADVQAVRARLAERPARAASRCSSVPDP